MANNEMNSVDILKEVNRLSKIFSDYLEIKVEDGEIVHEFIANTPQEARDAYYKFQKLAKKYPDELNIR